MLGTGEGIRYASRLDNMKSKSGKEVKLFRAMCESEYLSIIQNNNFFIEYEWAMEKKWFAVSREHAAKWGEMFYPQESYKIIEITVLEEALIFMFYAKMLDNIGSAYAGDIPYLYKVQHA